MLRIFLTGDNHIGLKYANYEQGDVLSKYRLDALRNMIQTANSLECDIFAITGDLFHSRRGLGKQIVTEVVNYPGTTITIQDTLKTVKAKISGTISRLQSALKKIFYCLPNTAHTIYV